MFQRKGKIIVQQKFYLIWYQFYNSLIAGQGIQGLAVKQEALLASSILRACCWADYETDVENNRRHDVLTVQVK